VPAATVSSSAEQRCRSEAEEAERASKQNARRGCEGKDDSRDRGAGGAAWSHVLKLLLHEIAQECEKFKALSVEPLYFHPSAELRLKLPLELCLEL
jgi:hypothetical protein